MNTLFSAPHQITHVRREIKRRLLTVTDVERVTPRMQRVVLHSPELSDFESLAPDDHIKLFFPALTPGSDLCMRDYTPRKFDHKKLTLTVDFSLHGSGPAASWASSAKPGDSLLVGGPKKSTVVTDDFDWYLLIGDETALPAIGRRVEELRSLVPVTTIVLVETLAERQTFPTCADWSPVWISREGQSLDDQTLFGDALSRYEIPEGAGYIWMATEASTARWLRDYVSARWRHPKDWMKVSGYWTRGKAGTHK